MMKILFGKEEGMKKHMDLRHLLFLAICCDLGLFQTPDLAAGEYRDRLSAHSRRYFTFSPITTQNGGSMKSARSRSNEYGAHSCGRNEFTDGRE
jgi:hypothetical protein